MLVGRLGSDPELKMVGSTELCTFSLATNKVYKDKDGNKQEKVAWHNITVWGKIAANVNTYLQKGSMAFVEGEIDYQEYEVDGAKRYSTKIKADRVLFLDSVKNVRKSDSNNVNMETHHSLDDIPF